MADEPISDKDYANSIPESAHKTQPEASPQPETPALDPAEPAQAAESPVVDDVVAEVASPAPVVAPVVDNALRLEEQVSLARLHLERNFIFRKLGVVYDYASPPGAFPRPALPTPNDARDCKPNPAGIGTGMADSSRNTCILLDAYLTRLELGMGSLEEDRIMDRLVGGLIRLGTVAQRGRVARGLTADGRGFYPLASVSHCTHYAHGMERAAHSPAISPESQMKLRDICAKWYDNFQRGGFAVAGADPEEGKLAFPVDAPGMWEKHIRLLHLLAVAADVGGVADAKREYDTRIAEAGCARIAEAPPADASLDALLDCQIALYDLATLDKDEARQARIKSLMLAIGRQALPALNSYQGFETPEPLTEAVLDWHSTLTEGSASEAELLGRVHSAWPRLKREYDQLRPSAHAALIVALAQNEELWAEASEEMTSLVRAVHWAEVWEAGPLAEILLAHALGQEKNLWDPISFEKVDLIPIGRRFGFDHEPEPDANGNLPPEPDKFAAGLLDDTPSSSRERENIRQQDARDARKHESQERNEHGRHRDNRRHHQQSGNKQGGQGNQGNQGGQKQQPRRDQPRQGSQQNQGDQRQGGGEGGNRQQPRNNNNNRPQRRRGKPNHRRHSGNQGGQGNQGNQGGQPNQGGQATPGTQAT